MDHLPPIKYATSPYPSVPCLCTQGYDAQPLNSYPQRCGYNASHLAAGQFTGRSPADIASFLQTWLYFGTLHEIFHPHREIETEDFIRRGSHGYPFITTVKFEEYVTAFLQSVKAMSLPDAENELIRIQPCLNQLLSMTEIVCTMDDCPLPSEVILSFSVLGATMDCALDYHLHYHVDRNWGLRDLAINQMREAGWCSRDIHLADTSCSELTMFYMCYLRRDLQGQDHGTCSRTTCQANQIDDKLYVTKHTTDGCKCRHRQPANPEEVKRIIRTGNIPIISLTPVITLNGIEDLDVSVKEVDGLKSSLKFRFRAISHVWSDGLGNTKANSLPHCQFKAMYTCLKDFFFDEIYNEAIADIDKTYQRKLIDSDKPSWDKKLDKKVNEFSQWCETKCMSGVMRATGHFRSPALNLWIDTLCIPLEKEYKRKAIENMDKVYSASTMPIVLDAELQARSGRCSSEELLARTAVCGWMRRAWTYQEAILANAGPFIKFADTIVDLQKLLGRQSASTPGLSTSIGMYSFVPNWYRYAKWVDRLPSTEETRNEKAWREETERLQQKFCLARCINENLKSCFLSIRSIRIQGQEPGRTNRARRIKTVWNGLSWRTTSKEEDKMVIFALACCMSISEFETRVPPVLHCEKDRRMAIWLSQQTELPQGLLFVKGARLNNTGLCWVPSGPLPSSIEGEGIAVLLPGTSEFRIRTAGFILRNAVLTPGVATFIYDQAYNRCYQIHIDWCVQSSVSHRLCISTLGLILSNVVSREKTQRAVLIELGLERTVILRGVFKATADVSDADGTDIRRHNGCVFSAQRLSDNQSWIIG
ncbi:hypothetical protein LTR70_010547 [Exophiala xenobiotica]|nr:hypothetical protein LTR70_010547 [Exophiala xenobiotica]